MPGTTVNRLCGSSLDAAIIASRQINTGEADVMLVGGVESMSRAPWVMEKPTTAFAKPGAAFDTAIGWRFVNPRFADGEFGEKFTFSMPETAEEVGEVDGITREDADAFAARSHERALAAIEAGRFADEIVPVVVTGRKGAETIVDTDEGPRPGSTPEVLAGLREAGFDVDFLPLTSQRLPEDRADLTAAIDRLEQGEAANPDAHAHG